MTAPAAAERSEVLAVALDDLGLRRPSSRLQGRREAGETAAGRIDPATLSQAEREDLAK